MYETIGDPPSVIGGVNDTSIESDPTTLIPVDEGLPGTVTS